MVDKLNADFDEAAEQLRGAIAKLANCLDGCFTRAKQQLNYLGSDMADATQFQKIEIELRAIDNNIHDAYECYKNLLRSVKDA